MKFTIRELEFVVLNAGTSEAVTPFGKYVVSCEDDGVLLVGIDEHEIWGFDTVGDAFAFARKNWYKQITKALLPVREG